MIAIEDLNVKGMVKNTGGYQELSVTFWVSLSFKRQLISQSH
ncbi:hypothetical protein [Psychrobacter submarinus]|nr:hypothetical protein [Psychrobacter submarinus]